MKVFDEIEMQRLEDVTRMDRLGFMIRLIGRMGLRQSEAHELCGHDYDEVSHSLHIRGANERLLVVPEDMRLPLSRLINGRPLGNFILATRANGERRLGQRTFQGYLNRIAEQHGFSGLTVNNLRATCIVRHLKLGRDPRLLQKFLGIRALKSITKYRSLIEPPVLVGTSIAANGSPLVAVAI